MHLEIALAINVYRTPYTLHSVGGNNKETRAIVKTSKTET